MFDTAYLANRTPHASAQHGYPVQGSPWEGGDAAGPQDYLLQGVRALQQPCLYTNTVLSDTARDVEMLAYVEYAYATADVQLQRSEGG